ncbi:MAG: hypothetical protein WC959_01080 [Kiritimatiellales bacterium]
MGLASFFLGFYRWDAMSTSKLVTMRNKIDKISIDTIWVASEKDKDAMCDALIRIDAVLKSRGVVLPEANHGGFFP